MTATLAIGTKVCPKCGVERDLDDFSRDKSKASGRKSLCRACDSLKSIRYYRANREIVIVRRAVARAAKPKADSTKLCPCGAATSSRRHIYCEPCRARRRQQRERERVQGRALGTTRRGYGAGHQKTRLQWASVVATGECRCARGAACFYAESGMGGLIDPREPWDLGHDDDNRGVYSGPEHRRCNRATSGRRARTNASRTW